VKDIKQGIYERLKNDATLVSLLGGANIYHYKKPDETPAGTKLIVYQEFISSAMSNNQVTALEAYQVTIESSNPDTNDEIYERVRTLLNYYSFEKNNTGGHFVREDYKSPDILLDDNLTWQLVVRYIGVVERK